MTPQAVLEFWFGPEGSPQASGPRTEWFRKNDAFDAAIAATFGPTIETALSGGLLDWSAWPESALARILLLDQFTRNAFRGTPRAFAGDALALAEARAMVATRQDLALPPMHRWFAYLPFEHAEEMTMQDTSVRLFETLRTADSRLAEALDYARRHREVIARFGRFPHRNAILDRTSTIEEVEFLKQPGSSF